MRVALVFRNFNMGGSLERDVTLLARCLAHEGIDVHCYCNPDTRTAELEGVTFHDVRPATVSRSRLGYPAETGSFARRATRALRADRDRYDVIDVTGTSAWEHDVLTVHAITHGEQDRWPEEGGRDFRLARTRARAATVLRPHLGLARGIERLQFRAGRFARVIAVADSVRDDIVTYHGVDPALIDVIPPPVDLARFRAPEPNGIRKRFGIALDDRVLLFVGHDFERKGLTEAIGALQQLGPRDHLLVVGSGNQAPYRKLADELGVAGLVHFAGGTEEPERFYAEADVVVLPTRHDPVGIPIIEAMAAGLPVVTTPGAGAAAAVEAARAGVLVPDRAPRELGDAVASLLRDPDRARELGRRGRESARHFGLEAHTISVLAVYEKAMMSRGRSSSSRDLVGAGR